MLSFHFFMTYHWQAAPVRRSDRARTRTVPGQVKASAGRKKHTHQRWLQLEDEKRKSPDWKDDEIKKWLSDTRVRREEAQEIFEREQRELAETEEEEAAERERQAEEEEEGGNDQECELCGEKEDRPDDDVILLCDFEGCLGASHLGCCDPSLQGVPEGDVSISNIFATVLL